VLTAECFSRLAAATVNTLLKRLVACVGLISVMYDQDASRALDPS
jgi:hypothetical protein